MVAHHIITIAIYTIALYLDESGQQVCVTLFIAEISTPVLQLRYFARYHKFSHKTVFLLDAIFGIIFVNFRIILGSYLMYVGVYEENVRLVFKLTGVLLYFVSWIFIGILVTKLRNNYQRIMSARAGGSQNARSNKK